MIIKYHKDQGMLRSKHMYFIIFKYAINVFARKKYPYSNVYYELYSYRLLNIYLKDEKKLTINKTSIIQEKKKNDNKTS